MIKTTENRIIIEIATEKPKEVLKEIQQAIIEVIEMNECTLEVSEVCLNALNQLLLNTLPTVQEQLDIFKDKKNQITKN
jgi:hypothetical protein